MAMQSRFPTALSRLRPHLFALLAILPGIRAEAQGLISLADHKPSNLPPSGFPLSPILFPDLQTALPDPQQRLLGEQDGLFEAINDSLYVVGTGDVFVIGLGNKSPMLTVNAEGYVVIENVGPVPVADKTLREAKQALIARASKVYRVDRLFATLAKAKRIQASIAGAVVNPGIYVLGGTARLSDALSHAGGFAPMANRRVTVAKRSGDTLQFDLDGYVRENDMSQNPYLMAGDQVRALEVDYESPLVEIRENDQVTVVQLKEGQTARDLIASYYRTRKPRDWSLIRVFRGGKQDRTLARKDAASFVPESGDVLELSAHKPLVFVTGAVSRPAALDFNVNFTALDYISFAGVIPITGKFDRLEVVDAEGKTRWVDASRDKIVPGDHILVPQSAESRARDWIGLLASVASIVASVALTVVTMENR